MELVARTTCCVCGAKQTSLSKEQETHKTRSEKARRRLRLHASSCKALRDVLKNLRSKIYRQSKALRQYGKTKDHHQKVVTKGVNIGNTREREGSTASSRWIQSTTKVFDSKKTNKTRLRNMGPHRDLAGQVERSQVPTHKEQTNKQLVAATGSPTSTRRVVQRQFKRTRNMP